MSFSSQITSSEIITTKTIEESLLEKEQENITWRPLLFHFFAALEMDR